MQQPSRWASVHMRPMPGPLSHGYPRSLRRSRSPPSFAVVGHGQILVDKATHDAVKDLVVSQDLGTLRLAGKSDWVPTFNILGLKASPG
jgi:hypothetical protein